MMTGITLTGISIGRLVGPPVANWLIATYDWRVAYIILGGVVLVIVVSAAQFLKRDPSVIGQVHYGENEGGGQELKAGAEGFSLKEAVCTRQFWLVFTILFCMGFGLFTITVHIVSNATDLGISATSAASILAAIGGASIVGNIILGGAAERIGNRQVFIIGFILISAALFWLVIARETWMFYLFAIVLGFAGGGMAASDSPLVAGLFGLNSHGVILGVTNLGFTIGAALGPFLAGSIFDNTGSYQTAFLLSAAISIVGIVITALLTPITGEWKQTEPG